MIDTIIDGILAVLSSEYANCKLYTESVEQGMVEPCFSILCLSPEREKQNTLRFRDDLQFVIRYFPVTDEPYSECMRVSENLMDVLELIELSDKTHIRGDNMRSVVVDKVLQFMITYHPFLIEDKDLTNMETLTQNDPEVN